MPRHESLVIFVPSRGRPHTVAQMAEAWKKTEATATLLFRVDDDDPWRDAYVRAGELNDVPVEVGPRLRLGPTLNELAARYGPDWDACGFMGDDHRPRTIGWDVQMLCELDRLGHGIVYGDDLFQREKLPTAAVMSSSIPQTLGYMLPPGLTHLYIDNSWKLLGEAADCISYLPNVVIEHVHPFAQKAEWDPGYEEVNAESMYTADRAVFTRYRESGRLETDAAKIRALRGDTWLLPGVNAGVSAGMEAQ